MSEVLSPSQQALSDGFIELTQSLYLMLDELCQAPHSIWQKLNAEAMTDELLMTLTSIAELEETGTVAALEEELHLLNAPPSDDPEAPEPADQLLVTFLCQIMLTAAVALLKLRKQEPVAQANRATFLKGFHERLQPVFDECLALMLQKNHDYGDSWRYMRVQSITDQMLIKTIRLIQLEELDAQGKSPKVSEGRESEYRDIFNYAVLEFLKLTTIPDWPELPPRKYSEARGELG